ncbi:hypothetical protein HPB52_011360 [Rhipicephalus sanguineus]|uniref:Uncharacterized protein n=1 Tax=Rhipicephalus sanguineus TaxID=34632 RepID=A0A9D4PZG5_RHISA|nr:hypothetical protein HPB52_011360 [Rhipicephalus sanguineus]
MLSFVSFRSATWWKPASIVTRPATRPTCAPSSGRSGAIVAAPLTPHRPKDRHPFAPPAASSATGITPRTAPTANSPTFNASKLRKPWYLTLTPRHLVRPRRPRALPSKLHVVPHHPHPPTHAFDTAPRHLRLTLRAASRCITARKRLPPTAAPAQNAQIAAQKTQIDSLQVQLHALQEKLGTAITKPSSLLSPINSS